MDSEQLKTLVLFLIKRKLFNLGKSQLRILDELRKGSYNINEKTLDFWRNNILNDMNNSYREIEETIEKMNIEFLK